MKVAVEVRGIDAAIATLRRLGQLDRPEIINPALQAGANVLAVAWAARIRRKSGRTADAISATIAKPGAGEAYRARVTAGARAHVARFLEYGYTRRNKRTGQITQIQAYPSGAAAFESARGAAEAAFDASIIAAAKAIE